MNGFDASSSCPRRCRRRALLAVLTALLAVSFVSGALAGVAAASADPAAVGAASAYGYAYDTLRVVTTGAPRAATEFMGRAPTPLALKRPPTPWAEGHLAAKAGASALEEASEAAFRASRGPINISRKHYPGAGGRHSRFEQGVDIDATVREALQSPGAIFRPNRNAAGDIVPGYRVYADLGRTVGTRGETGLRAIVSPDGRVITSFPGKPWG